MKLINPCSWFTLINDWSSLHEHVVISGKRALMPDATVGCLLGGLVSIVKPNMPLMLECAKISKWMYCDPGEDTDVNDAMTDENGNGLETFADFEKYKPEGLGWSEVTPEELMEKGILEQDAKGNYILIGNKRIKYSSEDYQGETRYYFVDSRNKGYQYDDSSDNGSGLKVGMYEKDGHYILAARGTHRSQDWTDDNLAQGLGLGSEQYRQVIALSKTVSGKLHPENVTITGHSMGGGTSSAAGIVTGCETYSFDPAGVHENTIKGYGVTRENSSNVYSVYSDTDPLNNVQNLMPDLMPTAVGNRLKFSTANKLNISDPWSFIVNGHDLPMLIDALEQQVSENGEKGMLLTKDK